MSRGCVTDDLHSCRSESKDSIRKGCPDGGSAACQGWGGGSTHAFAHGISDWGLLLYSHGGDLALLVSWFWGMKEICSDPGQ